jgi:hypothetical protein
MFLGKFAYLYLSYVSPSSMSVWDEYLYLIQDNILVAYDLTDLFNNDFQGKITLNKPKFSHDLISIKHLLKKNYLIIGTHFDLIEKELTDRWAQNNQYHQIEKIFVYRKSGGKANGKANHDQF